MIELNIKNQTDGNDHKELLETDIQELNLVGHMEKVIELANDSKLSVTFYKDSKPHTDFIAKKLGLTAVQSVLISLFVNNSNNRAIELTDLCDDLGCTNIAMIALMNDIDILVSKKYIRLHKQSEINQYSVPIDFIEALRKEMPYIPTQFVNLNETTLFTAIEKILNTHSQEGSTFETMIEDLTFIIENNKHLQFCKKIEKYRDSDNSLVIIIAFSSLLVNDDDNMVGFHDFIELLEDKRVQRQTQREMQRGEHALMSNCYDLIEFTNQDGLTAPEYFKLTKKGREELLSDYQLIDKEIKPKNNLVSHNSLKAKELFYNEHETNQINQLESLLQNQNFKNVQQRLEQSGMRKGFACLFYGAPGTGKTETAYQIARRTGRDIMVVNVAQIKNCFVGESEKNIKALFDLYRRLCSNEEIAPILLFNEADAVIGIRQEAAQKAIDKMENSIQNIILQEMETLDGIMIATTNLTQNLDKAFERRFLYKIEFTKPSIEAKQAIWKTMMPSLSDNEVNDLAREYEFSGGQIENIARKRTVDSIINGDEPSIDTIHTYCKSEQIYKTNERRSVGFKPML